MSKIIMVAVLVVVAIVSLPTTASAVVLDPATPTTQGDRVTDPPLPIPAPPEPPHTPQQYTVKEMLVPSALNDGKGNMRVPEDLATIAMVLKLTTDEIKYSNPDKDVTQLKAGDVLTVPPVHGVVYKIQVGDTLRWIADKWGVDDFNKIATYNKIPNPDSIKEDTVIVIPDAKFPPKERPTYTYKPTTYSVPQTISYSSSGGGGNHFFWGYCTWYVADKWIRNGRSVPWFGDAGQWPSQALGFGMSEGQTPRVGAIMATRESYFGHVAYVESVNSDGSWVVSEMNYQGFGIVDQRTIKPGGVPLIAFIY